MHVFTNRKLWGMLLGLTIHSLALGTFQPAPFDRKKLPYISEALTIMRDSIDKGAHKKTPLAKPIPSTHATKHSSKPSTQDNVIHLTQKDFDSGTYRIRTPNTTVILDTDIEFEPLLIAEATRTDKPIIGWFAAITVETDNVTIDLNGKTIQASEFFLANDIENAFAVIELDNALFAGPIFGLLGAFFPGDTEFVSAHNVTIKNGTIGRTDHWCIHGNNNSGITIENVHAKDFPIAGIEFNGIINSQIRNVSISGLEHIIRTNFAGVAAATLINYLAAIANIPDEPCFEGACEQLASLLAYVAENPLIFNAPRVLPQGAQYGIQLGSGFTNFVTFPTTPENCALAAFLTDGRTVEDVKIDQVSISGLKNAPEESVLIASQADGQILNLPLLGIPVFGALTWDSAFDPEGNFAPTPFLQAQIFVINTQLCLFPDIIGAILPPNYSAIAQSIMTGDEALFLANTFPVFGIALDSVDIKGTFGIRFDCSKNCSVTNVTTQNIQNVGAPGATLADIPDGIYYEGLVTQTRYIGNDCWGLEFSTQTDSTVDNCTSCKISSLNGDVFGLDLIGNNATVSVNTCVSKNIDGFGDDVGSVVNPPATAYGFRAQNNSGPVSFEACKASHVIAPRNAFGFAAEDTDSVVIRHCSVDKIVANSSKDLLVAPKQAFGYDLENARATQLTCVNAKNIAIQGEEKATKSLSIAAGIGIDSDSQNNVITCPSLHDIKGGAGKAYKIYDQGTATKVTKKACKKCCKTKNDKK